MSQLRVSIKIQNTESTCLSHYRVVRIRWLLQAFTDIVSTLCSLTAFSHPLNAFTSCKPYATHFLLQIAVQFHSVQLNSCCIPSKCFIVVMQRRPFIKVGRFYWKNGLHWLSFIFIQNVLFRGYSQLERLSLVTRKLLNDVSPRTDN